jgi:hypothetical protein
LPISLKRWHCPHLSPRGKEIASLFAKLYYYVILQQKHDYVVSLLPIQFLAHLSVEDVSNFVYIIGQVCLGAHEERVSSGVGSSSTSCQAAQCLVDVEQRDV